MRLILSCCIRRTWISYSSTLKKHPLATKVISSAGIAGIGDIICQIEIEKSEKIDIERLITFTMVGGMYITPLLHVSYGMLNRLFVGTSTKAVIQRVFVDQFLLTPPFLVSYFGLMQSLSKDDITIKEKLTQEFWPTMYTNWAVWIPVQWINFRRIAPPYQVLFSNMVSLFWNAYMSYVSYRKSIPTLAV